MKVFFFLFFIYTLSQLPEDINIENSILIQNGIIVNAHLTQKNDILVQNGKITKIGKNLNVPKGCRIIDAHEKYVMPGGIVNLIVKSLGSACIFLIHSRKVHMSLPFMGTVSADDFYTGTRAALSGGTTMICIFDFNSNSKLILQ